MRQDLYINKQNWERFEGEENKSGLVNSLLLIHYNEHPLPGQTAHLKLKASKKPAKKTAEPEIIHAPVFDQKGLDAFMGEEKPKRETERQKMERQDTERLARRMGGRGL